MKKKWHIVYTKPCQEKKVADLLEKKKVPHYCPLTTVARQFRGRTVTVQEPLFPSFVFVQIRETEFMKVKETGGVINFVYWIGNPAEISDAEIDTIRSFVAEHENVQLEQTPLYRDDSLQVAGSYAADHGTNGMHVADNQVRAFLPSMGYLMVAEVQKTNVVVIKRPSYEYRLVR